MGGLLHYAVVLVVVALVAAFLGFGGLAGTAMEGASLLIWAALALIVVGVLVSALRRAG